MRGSLTRCVGMHCFCFVVSFPTGFHQKKYGALSWSFQHWLASLCQKQPLAKQKQPLDTKSDVRCFLARICGYIYKCIHICLRVCMYVCMYVCIYIYIYIICTYAHMVYLNAYIRLLLLSIPLYIYSFHRICSPGN